jgi:hypothetical protein
MPGLVTLLNLLISYITGFVPKPLPFTPFCAPIAVITDQNAEVLRNGQFDGWHHGQPVLRRLAGLHRNYQARDYQTKDENMVRKDFFEIFVPPVSSLCYLT